MNADFNMEVFSTNMPRYTIMGTSKNPFLLQSAVKGAMLRCRVKFVLRVATTTLAAILSRSLA
ncbi:MAG TPA: hypothetical protein ENI77_02365 [Nitrospirae bacterium]|nr:hypothetical protein [Nitrospirota bacterium]